MTNKSEEFEKELDYLASDDTYGLARDAIDECKRLEGLLTKSKISGQDFLLKRIENKATLECGAALKQYVEKYGDEKGCEIYALLNSDCNEDDALLDHYINAINNKATFTPEGCNLVRLFKELVPLERQSALAIASYADCIEVYGEAITLNSHIKEQNNDYFQIIHNKELDCFDMVMKKPNYDTSTDLLGILSFVHQMGVNCSDTLRIGARIEDKSNIVVNKPKIII